MGDERLDYVTINSADATLGPIFSADDLKALASNLPALGEEAALEVVSIIAEMLRRVECRRHNLPE